MQHQLTQRPQDQEDKNPAHAVHQEQPRSGLGKPAAGAEEQAGPNRAADPDHLQLSGLEAFVIAGLFAEGVDTL
ncbi:Uncharacterised protein [Mycobacterium tuberculosis]|uniref:Uncharacterized protein n=1 Tax=Mycobacterium tuberculosis TaxID=1773 RepID=A0A655AIE3_MYCTX|nr:Uncharacterised protein [Mycobacterium tuberculosis]CNL67231.1 Uncharacterised protein [Mycobacterium tuberculosis]COW22987.1 Uncharacterised protein [Mycobacterium tuberculosis]